jgi:hypothetical protein
VADVLVAYKKISQQSPAAFLQNLRLLENQDSAPNIYAL